MGKPELSSVNCVVPVPVSRLTGSAGPAPVVLKLFCETCSLVTILAGVGDAILTIKKHQDFQTNRLGCFLGNVLQDGLISPLASEELKCDNFSFLQHTLITFSLLLTYIHNVLIVLSKLFSSLSINLQYFGYIFNLIK